MHDLVIRGGTLVDGTGSPAVVADVAVTGGVIVAVGENLGHASRTVDADGALVTPGFVDVHTHYDAQASWDPYLTPSSWHGVTTAVMGNCGVGFAPAAPDRHEWLIELMEGVEDIPGAALTDGIDWQWETFPQYLDALDARRYAIDIAAQVPHGALRAYVMGDRGAANESATDADIAEMARLVAEGLSAGALGFTTSRTPLHRSRSGELVPGTTADAAELMGIASAMPHGVVQFAPYHPDVPTSEWQWMRELAAATGRTVSVNLNQPDQHPEVWRDVLARLDEAIADNVPIVAQVGGRGVGLLMCLEGSYHPLMFHPVWAEIAHLTHAEQVAALREPERRHRLITEMPDDGGLFERAALGAMWKIWAVDRADIDYEPLPDDSLAARATREGRPAIELALDQLLSDDGRGFLYSTFFSYSYGDLSFIHDAQLHPGTRMGLADAGAHCRVICDGGMPTFMLTHWARDRQRGPRLPLEYVVHRQTRQTADLYGLGDRGSIVAGQRADINVIDFERLGFAPAAMAHDLPGGAPRLVQPGRGYLHTFVAGVETVTDDTFTGELPGRLVRGPR
ncbi:MAG: amidohydrolase family protein [Actinomycetota bacterium]|jgi:N-acyl-D-amino-acid deacylase|nr:amidohydrolase family protein [Actinomycetota bacterium]MDA3016224.1 amidohydrolase family protein [Actinomycetota bacterium]MDA3028858.1 amidohydrolase family protein [Actinomycetota bacterium]